MQDNLSIVLGLISSMISIIGFVLSIFKHENKLIKILFFLILVLSITTAYFAYQYKNKVAEIVDIDTRKEVARKEATELLKKLPYYILSYDPGINQGIVYSVLSFLENYQVLFPETYKNYKSEVIDKLKRINAEHYSDEYDKQLKIASESALTFLKSIAE